MKILVFGNSGSGKSTYHTSLGGTGGCPFFDLDSIVWEPGQIAVQRSPESVEGSLRSFIDLHPAWVIEGCYGETHSSGVCTLQAVGLPQSRDRCVSCQQSQAAMGATQVPRPLRLKTPCSASFKNGYLSATRGTTLGHTAPIVRSSTHSQGRRSSIVDSVLIRKYDETHLDDHWRKRRAR